MKDFLSIGVPLLLSALGAGGQAYLGAKQVEQARADARADREEGKRQFDLQYALQKEAQPVNMAGNLLQLRQALGQPTQYDFLSALNARQGG